MTEIETRQSKMLLDEVVTALINGIKEVEATNESITVKSRKFKGLATKAVNALFGKRAKIKPNTGIVYTSKIRAQVTKLGLFHHSFDQSMAKLIESNPLFASELEALNGLPLVPFREGLQALKVKCQAAEHLLKELGYLKPSQADYPSQLTTLSKRYQDWESDVKHLKQRTLEKRTQALETLKEKLAAAESLQEAVSGLKIDHEVMRWLKPPVVKKEKVENQQAQALDRKKSGGVIHIDYKALMAHVEYLANPKIINETWTWEAIATAVAFATGRRPIEVLLQGKFEKIDQHRLWFSGQAKERGGVDYENRFQIYSLIDADFVLQAVERLRDYSTVKALNELDEARHYEKNRLVNNRVAGPLNQFMRRFMLGAGLTTGIPGRDWVFKDTRAIYGKLCYDLFFEADPRWEKMDADVFYKELLGHSELNAQQHYKHIKFRNLGKQWKTIEHEEKDRFTELEKLDDHPELSSKAMQAIHQWVKDYVRANPSAEVISNTIRRGKGTRLDSANRYLEVVKGAIGLDYSLADILASDEDVEAAQGADQVEEHDEPEAEPAPVKATPAKAKKVAQEKPQPAERPHFKAPHKNDDGTYLAEFDLAGATHTYTVTADDSMAAMKQAWAMYQDELKGGKAKKK
ncbi:protelomerase family protein [Rheinheimera sp.]|uniref:protelomerase family protein n=1 Tax=Rheinheimera sp. TaxID=1869214 RepID=UPI00307CC989